VGGTYKNPRPVAQKYYAEDLLLVDEAPSITLYGKNHRKNEKQNESSDDKKNVADISNPSQLQNSVRAGRGSPHTKGTETGTKWWWEMTPVAEKLKKDWSPQHKCDKKKGDLGDWGLTVDRASGRKKKRGSTDWA